MNNMENQEVINLLSERAKTMSSSAAMCHALYNLYQRDPNLSIAKIVEFILDQHDSVFGMYQEMIRLRGAPNIIMVPQKDFMERFKDNCNNACPEFSSVEPSCLSRISFKSTVTSIINLRTFKVVLDSSHMIKHSDTLISRPRVIEFIQSHGYQFKIVDKRTDVNPHELTIKTVHPESAYPELKVGDVFLFRIE